MNILTGLCNAAWDLNYEQFCVLCGWDPDRAYAEQKWAAFQQMTTLINQFQPEVLEKLASANSPTEQV
ncbi:MAG: hypothetical protein NW237_03890 [Cyanobacteriota bacterium]|nr:hypothetical protein [Cyanobacteriota bacterium]